MTTTDHFGTASPRREDLRLLRGQGTYVDDIHIAGALHVSILRSTEAHAQLNHIDIAEARQAPGVIDVIVAADLADANRPATHPTWQPGNSLLQETVDIFIRGETLRVLVDDVARFSGEPVAAIVAEKPYLAADASEFVTIDYSPLPVITDIDAALQSGAPLVRPDWGDNVSARFTVEKGDVARAFAAADVVVKDVLHFKRQSGAPMEPRGVLAVPDGDGGITVWSSTQAPFWLRDELVKRTGMPSERIRVIAPDVGGGFGVKAMVYPEELLIPLIAIRLGHPVRWVETRSEHFSSVIHARDQRHEIELALTASGQILGLRDRYIVDVGASNVQGLIVPYNTAAHLQGAYRVPQLEISCTCVVTNKPPLSSCRGSGRPEAVFAMERILDRGADELGIEPLELRRRNIVGLDDMPYDAGISYRDGSRLILDGGDTRECLEVVAKESGYDDIRQRQDAWRKANRFVGIGLATYIEGTGIGPAETAILRLDPSGEIIVSVALPSQGQGHATVLTQICADEIGAPPESIRVIQGDTDAVKDGGGTIASRSAVILGNAVAKSSQELRQRILSAAGDLMEVAAEDLQISNGRVSVRGAPDRFVTLAEVATSEKTHAGEISAAESFSPDTVTFAVGAHAAVVEVDPQLGSVTLLKYVIAHDCGRVINPAIVEGQIAGGAAQGIGGALLEELIFDGNGQLVTGSFMDYLIPRATDLPDIEIFHIETRSERNPLGIKGVGEAGTIGPPAAIAGAIEDALRPFQARVTECPLTPERVAALVET